MGSRSSSPDPVPDHHVRRSRLAVLPQPGPGRRSVIHDQGRRRDRHVAGGYRRRDAGASCRSDEKKLQELPYFDKVTTYTKPAFTAMQVAFKDNTPAREVPELFYQLRKKVADIKDDLPAGIIGPSVNDEYGDVDSILYMLTADGADYAQMKKVAQALRQRLLKVKDVTKVNLYGTQD